MIDEAELLALCRAKMRYDEELGGLFWTVPGHGHRLDVPAGSLTAMGYRRVFIGGRSHYAHRLVWLLVYGKMPSKILDHIDGNKTNNRISNLRECTDGENSQNRVVNPNRDLPVGVRFYWKGYKACIRTNNVRYELGTFRTPEEASEAYLAAKARLHTFQPVPRYHKDH